jgi:hypothetical protein
MSCIDLKKADRRFTQHASPPRSMSGRDNIGTKKRIDVKKKRVSLVR